MNYLGGKKCPVDIILLSCCNDRTHVTVIFDKVL